MTSIIRGQPVERIVVHGSEQIVWESPTSGAMLNIAEPSDRLPVTDNVHVDFGCRHKIKSSHVSMADRADLFLSGKKSSMNGITIKGHVTVQVEDAQGNIKQRVEADNALSPAALNTLLYNGLTKFTTTAQTVLGFGGTITQSQQVGLLGHPAFGIYALTDTVNPEKIWIKPPYAAENYASLSDKVLYHCVGDNLTEDVRLMARVPQRSYFDLRAKFHAEYVKSMGMEGTIKSIVVGTAHSALTAANSASRPWGISWNEPVQSDFFTASLGTAATHGVALEHKIDRTIAHCRGGSNYYAYDFKTQGIVSKTGTTNLVNGYLVHETAGTRIANIVDNDGIPTASEHNLLLSTSINWDTPVTRVLITPNITADSLNTNRGALPVLVMRPDTGQIEIFLSLDYDAGGCRLVKAVLDANNPTEGAVTWVEMGRIPYVIGYATPSARINGYYDTDTSTYWLPYSGFINTDGVRTACTGSAFVPGVKLRASDGVFNRGTYNDSIVVDFYIARTGTFSSNVTTYYVPDIVKTPFGIHQGHFRSHLASERHYYDYGVVFSAVNLPTPIYRDRDDVLRLIYTYQLGNA
jgi:hypothetical protein